MVDLETLGTVPGCAILSIGAVEFDRFGVRLAEYYSEISTNSCQERFLTVSEATRQWWMQQDEEARGVVERCAVGGEDIKTVLETFAFFIKGFGDDVCVWGNGSDFDNALLAVAYEVCGMKLPWSFTNNRCYRTLKNLFPDITLVRQGTYHNSLHDARTQAEHAARLLERLTSLEALEAEFTDDSLEIGEDGGAPVQQQGFGGLRSGEPETESAGVGLPRSNVPTGIR
jgi:hypothetical protein